jgi:hypothetical protein
MIRGNLHFPAVSALKFALVIEVVDGSIFTLL